MTRIRVPGHFPMFLVVVLMYLTHALGTWHPYDLNKNYPKNCHSNLHSEQVKVPNKDFMNKIGLWPNLVSTYYAKHGEVMYGFAEGIEHAWKHQHPANCSQMQFLVVEAGWDQGFGSETHVIGSGLAVAMNMNRVYVLRLNKENTDEFKLKRNYAFEIDTSFCREQKKMSLECYYLPWSSCTMKDVEIVLQGKSLDETLIIEPDHYDPYNPRLNYLDKYHQSQPVIRIRLNAFMNDDLHMPRNLHRLWECSPIRNDLYRYWWRAISTAYLLRPNPWTLSQIALYRKNNPQLQFNAEVDKCISINIRRGDKHIEMTLLTNNTAFFETANLLWKDYVPKNIATSIIGKQQQQNQKPILFIGSEDPFALEEAKIWTKQHQWRLIINEVFDRHQVQAWMNYTEQQTLIASGHSLHHEREYLSMIFDLDYHLQCSAFVCTMGSNFCRIIDELRATVGGKANAVYAEMNCPVSEMPCINSHIDIGWR
jgi:hypothetical protein